MKRFLLILPAIIGITFGAAAQRVVTETVTRIISVTDTVSGTTQMVSVQIDSISTDGHVSSRIYDLSSGIFAANPADSTLLFARRITVDKPAPASEESVKPDFLPRKERIKYPFQFAWGAELGGSIDMTGSDMASFNFGLHVGVRYRWIKFLGVGLSYNIMTANSCRHMPIFAELRTDFSSRPRLLFFDIKGGVSVNSLPENISRTGGYIFTGIGCNLAKSKNFSSYLLLGYSFVNKGNLVIPADSSLPMHTDDISYATVSLGVTF